MKNVRPDVGPRRENFGGKFVARWEIRCWAEVGPKVFFPPGIAICRAKKTYLCPITLILWSKNNATNFIFDHLSSTIFQTKLQTPFYPYCPIEVCATSKFVFGMFLFLNNFFSYNIWIDKYNCLNWKIVLKIWPKESRCNNFTINNLVDKVISNYNIWDT